MTLALLAALALGLGPQDPGTGTIHGQVRSEATGAPLAAAAVEIRDASGLRPVLTDALGRYRLSGVPPGRRLLRVTSLGHEPLEVEVQVGAYAELNVDVALRLRPVALSGIEVRGRVYGVDRDTAAPRGPGFNIATIRALEGTPGIAELGLGETPRGPPGQSPVDPSDVLYVRGAPTDLKLVLLDGAPVYTPFHVGGLLDAFDGRVIRAAKLHLGGAPARYDGGLSYILELSTRGARTDRARGAGAIDMMSASAVMEAGAGERFGLLLGGRGVHGQGLEPLLSNGFPYIYSEGLARLDAAVGKDGVLSVTGFRNQEGVSIGATGSASDRVAWGNRAVSARYHGKLEALDAELTAAYGGYEAALPVLGEREFPMRGSTERLRLQADLAHGGPDLVVRFGASVDRLSLHHEVRTAPGAGIARRWLGNADGATHGAYVDGSWQAAPWLRLRGGLRADLFLAAPTFELAPRLAATWLLSERAALTSAAGRYHQYVRTYHAPRLREGDLPDTLYLTAGLAVAGATHFNLALDQELQEGTRLGVEGFFKTFDDAGAGSFERGHASGVDVWVRRDIGRVRGWLGYSLAWVWSAPKSAASSDFAGRQLLNAGLTSGLGRWGDFHVRFAYGAGFPFSSIPMDMVADPQSGAWRTGSELPSVPTLSGEGALDAQPLPQPPDQPYLRLDLGISRSYTTVWRGSPVQVSPYLRVLNSLDRRDALFYRYDSKTDPEPRAVAALPLLPVLGVSWKF